MSVDFRDLLMQQTLQAMGQFQNPSSSIGQVGRDLLTALASQQPYGVVADQTRQNQLNRSAAMLQLLSAPAQMQADQEAAAYQQEQDALQMDLQRQELEQQGAYQQGQLALQQGQLALGQSELSLRQQEVLLRQAEVAAERGDQAVLRTFEIMDSLGVPLEERGRVFGAVVQAGQGVDDIAVIPQLVTAAMEQYGIAPQGAAPETTVLGAGDVLATDTGKIVATSPYPAQAAVSINQAAESEFAKQYMGSQADAAIAFEQTGAGAQATIDAATRMQTLLDNIDTGALQPTFATLQSAAGDLGLDVAGIANSVGIDLNNIGEAEEFDRLRNEIVAKFVADSSAGRQFSDADRRALEGALAGLGRSKEGNQRALVAIRLAAERAKMGLQRWQQIRNQTPPQDLQNAWLRFQADWETYTAENPLSSEVDRVYREQQGPGGVTIGQPAAPAATMPDGRRIHVDNGRWVYDDGTPVQ